MFQLNLPNMDIQYYLPPFALSGWDVLQEIRHSVFWPQMFHTDGVHIDLIRFKPETLICWLDKNITLQIYIISMEFFRPKLGSLFQKRPKWQGAMKGAYIMQAIGDTN